MLLAILLGGCSNLTASDSDDDSSSSSVSTSSSSGKAAASIFIPNYSALAASSSSSARAIAPQTATVRLGYRSSSSADFTYDEANSLSLSDGTSADSTNSSGVAGATYSFTFTLPAATYSAGNIIIEMLDSSSNVLSSGTTSSECTISSGSETTASLSMIPSASSSNKSGSLSAGEMKFFELNISEDTTLTIIGDVTLFVFDSNGKLQNTDDISAPLETVTDDDTTTATIPAAESVTYYIGVYSESALDSYSVAGGESSVSTVDVIWDWTSSAVTLSASSEFASTTGTIQNSTGYAKGTSDDILLYVDATSGKLSNRTSDAQFNSGTIIQIPVSNGSVVTVSAYSTSYEFGGDIAKAVESQFTSTKAGYVVLKSTSSNYLNKISVTNLIATDDFTSDVVDFDSETDSTTANDSTVLGITATSVSSSDESVVTADLTTADGYITITSVAAGSAVITAEDSNGNEATIAVTVGDYGAVTIGAISAYSESSVLDKVTWDMDGTNSLIFYSDADCTVKLSSTTLQGTSGLGYVAGTSTKALLYVDATSGKFAYVSGSYVQVNANTKIYVPVSSESEITITMHSNNSAYKYVTVGSNSISMPGDSGTFKAESSGYLLVSLPSDASGAYMLGITATNVDTSAERSTDTTVEVEVISSD